MAAILCGSIGDLCSSCGKVLCLPCTACGIGCEAIIDILTSPFFPYILVTALFNIPVALLGLKSLGDYENCSDESQWMVMSGGFAVAHMIACGYIISRIRQDRISNSNGGATTTTNTTTTPVVVHDMEGGKTDEKTDYKSNFDTAAATATAVPVKGNTTTSSSYVIEDESAPKYSAGRIKEVLCYDKGVALYIIITIVWLIWQTMGLNTFLSHDAENCGQVAGRMLTSLFCGWFFASLVGIAFLCSMCCMRG